MNERSRRRAGHSTSHRPPVWVFIYSAIVGAALAVPMLLTVVMIPWMSDFVASDRLLGATEWAAPFCAVLMFCVVVTVNKVRFVAGKSPMPGPGSTKWLLVMLVSPVFGYFVCDAFITRAIGYVLHVASPAHEADIALSVSSAPDFTIRRCGYSARLEPDN